MPVVASSAACVTLRCALETTGSSLTPVDSHAPVAILLKTLAGQARPQDEPEAGRCWAPCCRYRSKLYRSPPHHLSNCERLGKFVVPEVFSTSLKLPNLPLLEHHQLTLGHEALALGELGRFQSSTCQHLGVRCHIQSSLRHADFRRCIGALLTVENVLRNGVRDPAARHRQLDAKCLHDDECMPSDVGDVIPFKCHHPLRIIHHLADFSLPFIFIVFNQSLGLFLHFLPYQLKVSRFKRTLARSMSQRSTVFFGMQATPLSTSSCSTKAQSMSKMVVSRAVVVAVACPYNWWHSSEPRHSKIALFGLSSLPSFTEIFDFISKLWVSRCARRCSYEWMPPPHAKWRSLPRHFWARAPQAEPAQFSLGHSSCETATPEVTQIPGFSFA